MPDEEIEIILDQSRIVDVIGRRVTDLHRDTLGTRAVVLCLDAKVAKAISKVDLAGGTQVSASQITQHLVAQRRSWRSRMLPGSA